MSSSPTHDDCVKNVEHALKNINTISYITEVLGKLGRPFTKEMVKCVPSGVKRHAADAGYIWQDSREAKRGEIVIREDQITTPEEIERSLRHELIHAFDDARGVIEPTNCYHHACSEIRAARLSGDCFCREEFKRGHVDLLQSGVNCVRRRATLAVEQNPVCRGYSTRAVERVFQQSYSDYEPFIAPIYGMGSYDNPTNNN